jgi:hypothetical protein
MPRDMALDLGLRHPRSMPDFEHLYGHDNELLTEKFNIVRVNEVLVDSYHQGGLFDGRSEAWFFDPNRLKALNRYLTCDF